MAQTRQHALSRKEQSSLGKHFQVEEGTLQMERLTFKIKLFSSLWPDQCNVLLGNLSFNVWIQLQENADQNKNTFQVSVVTHKGMVSFVFSDFVFWKGITGIDID